MRYQNSIKLFSGLIAIALVITSCDEKSSSSADALPVKAGVAGIQNEVEYIDSQASTQIPQKLTKNVLLQPGDTVTTKAGSSAILTIGNNIRVKVAPETEVVLQSMQTADSMISAHLFATGTGIYAKVNSLTTTSVIKITSGMLTGEAQNADFAMQEDELLVSRGRVQAVTHRDAKASVEAGSMTKNTGTETLEVTEIPVARLTSLKTALNY